MDKKNLEETIRKVIIKKSEENLLKWLEEKKEYYKNNKVDNESISYVIETIINHIKNG